MLMLVNQFFELASHLVYSNHIVFNKFLNMTTCWSKTKVNSYLTFLKNIFDTRKIFDDKPFMFFFLNPACRIDFFSVFLKSDMDPGCILLNINPIPIREIPTRVFPV